MKRLTALAFSTLMALSLVPAANAAVIDILWLGGTTTYNNNISQLGAGGTRDAATYDPDLDGSNSWNIDFWSAGTPDFSAYDALVIGSTCTPACGGTNGFFSLGVQPDLVLAHKTELDAARGDRTFVSGQDADWHYQNDSSPDRDDARAFLINAVNWAASGNDLGIVALADSYITSGNNGWLTNANSFLAADINNSRTTKQEESVLIPGAAEAAFPINEGLTSDKLSNWGTSSHTAFAKAALDPLIWRSINDSGSDSLLAVTIVSAETAGGGTTPTIPEPGTLLLLLFGAGGLMFRRRRVR